MSDSRFHMMIVAIVCLLAAGEVCYGVFGPFADRDSHSRVTDFSSINRTRN